ncbi:hypothetical protein PFUGPA_05932, partial [Plasmodium falciparum Palo Alto/Uganda]
MVTHGGSGDNAEKYKTAPDAKHLLDRIGEDIYKIVNKAALKYENELHGDLSLATYPGDEKPEKSTSPDPCKLKYEYHTNVTSNVIDPCNKRSRERFSDTKGAECDYRKIRDSEKKSNYGACAPFRRLSVCDTNLEQIDPDKIESTHNLLVDVCQAAKFEGASIRGYYAQYDEQYRSSGSTICTALARSFADIGDIVRGRDLFRGNDGEKKKREDLENKLKKIFGIIYGKLKNGKNGAEAEKRYGSDTTNYYQLREDWWEANRAKVWEAITCGHPGGTYFRQTCGSDEKTAIRTPSQCRCSTRVVPTYFDYVPQYLRWFEEWAEDFCRKRKKKIENAIKNCRGEKGNERYCDLNGYNCEETARGAEIFVKGDDCHKCSVACDRFVKWIDNQRKEFDKQKKKYDEEINKTHGTTITTGNGKINNLYVGHFYKILKKYYPTVDKFLQKLNDEAICKKPPNVGNEKASTVDFNNEVNTTFSHTTYCEACPWCGAQKEKNGGGWKAKEKSCAKKKERIFNKENSTDIKILTPEKGRSKILEKLKTFCKDGQKIKNDIWKCHYDDNGTDDQTDDSNDCVLGDWGNLTKEDKIMSYNAFFW